MPLRQSWTTDHESLCRPPGGWTVPIEELDLGVRTYNRLKRAGIHTCSELAGRSERDLLALEGFGPEMLEEVERRLAGEGESLRTPSPVTAREYVAFVDSADSSPFVTSVAFHPEGRLLATAGDDGTVRLWDVNEPRP